MAVSLKTDLRFPESGQHGHGSRIIQLIPKNSLIVKKDNILVIDNPDLFWA